MINFDLWNFPHFQNVKVFLVLTERDRSERFRKSGPVPIVGSFIFKNYKRRSSGPNSPIS